MTEQIISQKELPFKDGVLFFSLGEQRASTLTGLAKKVSSDKLPALKNHLDNFPSRANPNYQPNEGENSCGEILPLLSLGFLASSAYFGYLLTENSQTLGQTELAAAVIAGIVGSAMTGLAGYRHYRSSNRDYSSARAIVETRLVMERGVD